MSKKSKPASVPLVPVVPVPPVVDQPPARRPLTAAEARAAAVFPLEVRPGVTIRVRRSSPLTELFTRDMPSTARAGMAAIETGVLARGLGALTLPERQQVAEALRWYAVGVVVEPVITAEDDGDPTHVPVVAFTLEELFAISNAEPQR